MPFLSFSNVSTRALWWWRKRRRPGMRSWSQRSGSCGWRANTRMNTSVFAAEREASWWCVTERTVRKHITCSVSTLPSRHTVMTKWVWVCVCLKKYCMYFVFSYPVNHLTQIYLESHSSFETISFLFSSAGRWECPWHDCSVCGVPASSLCDFCPRSFCREHEVGALTPSSLEGRPCCSSHNPVSPLDSNSSSTQLHHSALSPVQVKEELEPEPGKPATEWNHSSPEYLIPCEVRSCSIHLWSEAALQKGIQCFLTSATVPLQTQDAPLNTSMLFVARLDWSVRRGSVQASLCAVFPPLLP